ncbi:MAG: ThuA domain-containing protein [Sphingobacteriales bacterium]|nr:ThuA domain-containing protein [Sphingobacteriales bacterium]
MRSFKSYLVVLTALLFVVSFQQCRKKNHKPGLLVFKKAEFYFHESTDAGVEAISRYCKENGIDVEVTDDAEVFEDNILKNYYAVVFLNTAGDVLNPAQQTAFEKYIHAGGGFMGIHTAIDTEHEWPWYGRMVGAIFESQSDVQDAILNIEDHSQPSTSFPDSTLKLKDEWFNLKNISPDIHILLSLDEKSYKGGTMGSFHPVSWYANFEGGRVFVTAMGHNKELYSNDKFITHLFGGLKYVIADKKLPDYEHLYKTDEKVTGTTGSGLTKTTVACNLYEPMQMDMFPDGKIMFIERRGEIKLFDPQTNVIKTVAKLDVFTKQEEGLLGFAIDPKWEQNNWVYFYYTPKDDDIGPRLSRFVYKDGVLDKSSEKVLFKVPLLRGDLFHAAGSICFDGDGYLYLATGDNTTHFAGLDGEKADRDLKEGFSQLDERPGREMLDVQHSSSNSMNLIGKILRIKPLPDGSYLCPAGNLYVNADVTLPGFENQKQDDPELQKKLKGTFNSSTLNVPGKPAVNLPANDPLLSSFGRPEIYVMGVRNPFRISYDNKRHALYWGDVGPDAPAFDSIRGSEGYDEINEARVAGFYGWPYFIGPNSAYRDFDYATKKPGAFFKPERTINNSPNNTGTQIMPPARPALIWYPFSNSKEFPLVANGTRCSIVGPTYYCDDYPAETRLPDQYNGKLIINDWMRNWVMAVTLDSLGNYLSMEKFAENITFSRPIHMKIDKKGTIWVLEYGMEWYSRNPDACLSRIDFVKGKNGNAGTGSNNALQWNFYKGNKTFYQEGSVLPYKLEYANAAMEHMVSQNISIKYLETEKKPAQLLKEAEESFKNNKAFATGQVLIDNSDCKSCHAPDRKINGPSFLDVSARYADDTAAPEMLSHTILNGGGGKWGSNIMIAHPQLTKKDADEIVKWILSLHKKSNERVSKEGRYKFTIPPTAKNKNGLFEFAASVTNSGDAVILRPSLQQAENADSSSGAMRSYSKNIDNTKTTLKELKNGGYLLYKHIDLQNLKAIELSVDIDAKQNQTGGGILEIHVDKADGALLGTINLPSATETGKLQTVSLAGKDAKWLNDGQYHDVYFVIKNENSGSKPVIGLDWIKFVLN